MRRFLFLIGLSIMLLLPSCEMPSLGGNAGVMNPPHDVLSPPEGMGAYHVVDVSSVQREGMNPSLPESFRSLSSLELFAKLLPSVTQMFGKGHFASVFEAMGLDPDNLFDDGHLYPSTRSVTTSNRIHIENEGVTIVKDHETLVDARIDFIDIILDADSPEFMKFLFNSIDGNRWNYSPSSASINGRLGVSGAAASISEEYDELAASAYLLADFYDLQIGSISLEIGGQPLELYFPNTGTLHIDAQASLASATMTYVLSDDTHVGGLGKPGGGGEVVYANVYCPYRLTLVVKETSYFDAESMFNAIRRMATSSSLTGEAIWNVLCSYVWPGVPGPYITISMEIPDVGDGTSRSISVSDWELFQFLM